MMILLPKSQNDSPQWASRDRNLLRRFEKTFRRDVLLMLVSPAFARIGDTEQQIEARYGKATDTLSKGNEPLQKLYRSSGLDIGVTYIDGVSQIESFRKEDQSALSKNEIALLLEANAAGSKWIEDPIASVLADLQVWKLESGGRKAVYKKSQGGF